MIEDYREYLSVDNGHGILISKDDAYILNKYNIDFYQCMCLKDLMILVENALDENDDEELESVLEHLNEVHYYNEVKK